MFKVDNCLGKEFLNGLLDWLFVYSIDGLLTLEVDSKVSVKFGLRLDYLFTILCYIFLLLWFFIHFIHVCIYS